MKLRKVECMNEMWAETMVKHLETLAVKAYRRGKAVLFEASKAIGWGECCVKFHGYTETPTANDYDAFRAHWGL